MAEPAEEVEDDAPLANGRFRVNIGSDTIPFTIVDGLQFGFDVITFRESAMASGGTREFLLPIRRNLDDNRMTMKKGIVRKESVKALFGWINSIKPNYVEKKDITISLLDSVYDPVITWKVINAFPVSLKAEEISADSDEVGIEEITMAYDWISMEES